MQLTWGTSPFGIDDLEEGASVGYRTLKAPLRKADSVRCCIRGCNVWLPNRTGKGPHEFCRQHGISVSASPTYVYKDWRRNFLIGRELMEEVKSAKTESWRLGNEASEDVVSWNTFLG